MTKRFGFTLAEVLITLGIIGVVAAMTIPTLISNTNGAKFRSQFKKTISTLNQAGLMSQAQYDFDYAGATTVCNKDQKTAATASPENEMSFCALLNGTLTGQTYQGVVTNITRNTTGNDGASTATGWALQRGGALTAKDAQTYVAYTLADGSIVAFDNSAKTTPCELNLGDRMDSEWIKAHTYCLGFIDVNGASLPNREVQCSNGVGTSNAVETPCTVKNNAADMTDVFPIVFHDATVEPASNAAKYVLTSAK